MRRNKVKYPVDPHQWFREPRFTVEQLFASLDLGGGIIWDASCGVANVLDVAREHGYATFGSDIVDRPGRAEVHGFRQCDFLKLRELPFRPRVGARVSLVCNPPYGKVKGVANMGERFVMHALDHFRDELDHMAFIMPIEFLAGQERYFDIYERRPPTYVLICNQRPSMPPGAAVEELGDAAFKSGMGDYCIVVWTREAPTMTQTIFMKPTVAGAPPVVERRLK